MMDDLLNEQIYTEAPGAVGSFIRDATANLNGFDGADKAKFDQEWNDNNNTVIGKMKNTNTALGTIKGIGDEIKQGTKPWYYDGKSIVARARNSVLQFPIYITQTMRPNEAQIISKLFERVYTSLVQAVLAQNPIISADEVNNLKFLKNFHTNLKESGDLFANVYYQPIDEIDEMMTESVIYSETLSPTMSVKFRWIPASECTDIVKENARLLNDPLTGLSYLKEDYSITKNTTSETDAVDSEVQVKDSEFENLARLLMGNRDTTNNPLRPELIDSYTRRIKAAIRSGNVNNYIDNNHFSDHEKRLLKNANLQDYVYKNGNYYRKETKKTTKVTSQTSSKNDSKIVQTVKAPILLRDADIKKINGMLPYTIEASFIIKDESISREVKFIIGIKSVLHPIRVQDLAEDLQELITGRIKKLQKVRYKTGEISFMDYMFNVKGLKNDAAKRIHYNKRWLNTLKRLGEYEKMNGTYLKKPIELITGGHAPIPNGTLILSQADVTSLTDQTGIDLSKVSNAKKLAKSLFLIGIAIVDSTAGSMRVLFPDSDTDWDVQSLATIDAEVSKTDNSPLLAEMRKLINK